MRVDATVSPAQLTPKLDRMWELSARKLRATAASWDPGQGSPVVTAGGRWTSRSWTEWTQGFLHGSALLQFDATGDREFLEAGRRGTLERMVPHLTHFGVHDHGFTSISTWGNLLRLLSDGRIGAEGPGRSELELALRGEHRIGRRRLLECDLIRGDTKVAAYEALNDAPEPFQNPPARTL